MNPMEAWKIVRGCLSELANIRHSLYPKGQGYSQEEITAQVICFEALRRMEEKKNNEHDK